MNPQTLLASAINEIIRHLENPLKWSIQHCMRKLYDVQDPRKDEGQFWESLATIPGMFVILFLAWVVWQPIILFLRFLVGL
jgi:hypothetical protein